MPSLVADDGVRLSYHDIGSGPPLVLVHGWMMSGRVWHKQVEAFRSSHRVIVPDLRGCGSSEAREGTHNIPRFAADLHALLEATGVRRATLVGWSMGGGICMEYLARHGTERVGAVGLVDFPPKLEEDPSVADKVCHNLNVRKESFTDGFLQRMFLAPIPAETKAWMLAESAKCKPAIACEMYRAMRHGDPVARPGPYPLPAFLAFPEKGWFPQALAEWRSRFRDVVAPPFPQSKHCPFLEETDTFNEGLRATMARVVA
jgi:pimeloyl-ACP methyl ester carboxylesterase